MQLAESPPSYRREIPAKADLERLCGYLDCLPLKLSQAASFMRQQNVTVGEYIQLVDNDESRLSDLLEHDFQAYGHEDDFSKAVACTWNVTFDLIAADSPMAADLLSFMAFLDLKNIPKFLLRYVETNEWNLTVTGLRTLQGYAPVNLAADSETFNIHRLVQHAMRKCLASFDAATKWSRKALSILSKQFPNGQYAGRHAPLLFHVHYTSSRMIFRKSRKICSWSLCCSLQSVDTIHRWGCIHRRLS